MLIIACPGQGSQTPGFLNDWLELDGAKEFLNELSDAGEIDLIKHGTISDAETIKDTAIAQPLIVAASLLNWKYLKDHLNNMPVGVAGHSVGEFAAAAIAGIITPAQALKLVGIRGKAMAEAAAQENTSMSAIIGGKEDQVIETIESHGLTAANRNGGGQIVAAGLQTKLSELQANPPRGTRVIPLQVAGAFHTEYMREAVSQLQDATEKIEAEDPKFTIWTNSNGETVTSGKKFISLLVSQIAQPVRWDLCMQSFQKAGATGMIELTPAGALTGIAKRGLKGTPVVAVKTPLDLEKVKTLTN